MNFARAQHLVSCDIQHCISIHIWIRAAWRQGGGVERDGGRGQHINSVLVSKQLTHIMRDILNTVLNKKTRLIRKTLTCVFVFVCEGTFECGFQKRTQNSSNQGGLTSSSHSEWGDNQVTGMQARFPNHNPKGFVFNLWPLINYWSLPNSEPFVWPKAPHGHGWQLHWMISLY